MVPMSDSGVGSGKCRAPRQLSCRAVRDHRCYLLTLLTTHICHPVCRKVQVLVFLRGAVFLVHFPSVFLLEKLMTLSS